MTRRKIPIPHHRADIFHRCSVIRLIAQPEQHYSIILFKLLLKLSAFPRNNRPFVIPTESRQHKRLAVNAFQLFQPCAQADSMPRFPEALFASQLKTFRKTFPSSIFPNYLDHSLRVVRVKHRARLVLALSQRNFSASHIPAPIDSLEIGLAHARTNRADPNAWNYPIRRLCCRLSQCACAD